jgi:hypothetical protein
MLQSHIDFHTFMLYPAGLSHSKKKIVNAEICTAATTTNNQDAASNGSEKYQDCFTYCAIIIGKLCLISVFHESSSTKLFLGLHT